MSQCKKFAPNIFHKSKCSNCFRQKEEHSAEALECNRASRSVARSGYLFVAPDWDFSVPLNRTKRWQRRWFVLYDDGELNYSVDEHPDTVPQGSVDMSKVLEVTGAEQITGHPHSLALTSPDRVTFVKAASREDARWWAELLAVFPRRHKRNATFPGGRASPSLPQLGRSASPQPPRPRHLSVTGPSPRTNFETPPLKEERESPPKEERANEDKGVEPITRPAWLPERTSNVAIENVPVSVRRNDHTLTSGSPPTRDKLRHQPRPTSMTDVDSPATGNSSDGKWARVRRDWRHERLRDIAAALTEQRAPQSPGTTSGGQADTGLPALPAEGLLHLKKGWLWLKTPENEWLRRWVVLCGPTLNIYQEQDEQGTPEILVELSTVTSYAEVPTDSKYGFEIYWAGPTLTLSAVTQGIRSNWMEALKKAAPIDISPISPSTPRSLLLSSDEEYKTASEGGRRGSEDWGDLPPSPPLNRLFAKVKDRTRLRPKLPRCQSRQSTLDSTSTDELDCAKEPDQVELNNVINKSSAMIPELQTKLAKSAQEVHILEEEIARLKKLQSDAAIREKKAKELLASLEENERILNQKNLQNEVKFLKEQKALQRRLSEAEQASRAYEEKCDILCRELQTKQMIISNLQDELTSSNDRLAKSIKDNDKLFKKVQELEGRYSLKNIRHIESLTDLTNIDLDVDIDELGVNELKEYCLDLKGRFEKTVLEIRALKRVLRESEENIDRLEITNHSLKNSIDLLKNEHEAEVRLLVARLDNLTAKLNSAEKQLKSKLKTEARDRRRSLSLKGRESFSINKEVEDKVTELEAKILALEKSKNKRRYKRDRSSERTSPIDDKALRRLRRKSLDSATSSEPLKLLIRLSSLESKVTNANESTESLNAIGGSITDLSKIKEDVPTTNELENLLLTARIKVAECLENVVYLRSYRRRSSSPNIDRLIALETTLKELSDILNNKENSISNAEIAVINSSADSVVKQLQTLLIEKLTCLAEKKRLLKENKKLDANSRLQILAEKVAYENVLVSRIQEALQSSPTSGEAVCDRLISKECKETAHMMLALKNKLNGTNQSQTVTCKTSADYLSKILAKCLISAATGFKSCKNFIASKSPSVILLYNEKKKLDALIESYKSTKLPQLAEALANEAINLSSDKTCRIRSLNEDAINEFNKMAREAANAELIKSEINHVLLRAAQIYQNNIEEDHTFFFSFFASERAALEVWSDAVADSLYGEVNKAVTELSELYQACVNKLQRQNWRRRVELERNVRTSTMLLQEFADVVAHKALIDARINVLSGKFKYHDSELGREESNLSNWLDNEKYWTFLENQSLFQINQCLEAEFTCMIDRFSKNCFALLGQPELEEVLGYLDEVAAKVGELQQIAKVPVEGDDTVIRSWSEVCQKCIKLRDHLEEVRISLYNSPFKRNDDLMEQRPVYLGTEYLTQVENLRAAYRCALASCKERHQEANIEHLQQLCERVLCYMEQWHRRTVQDLREAHAQEVEMLKQEKEQALAEETQATLAALDAMRKAHVAEVQREVAKFKQEFARQQRDEVLDLSERLSVKSLEAAALEEQLGSATRQLAHAQQQILQLEKNPPQLSAVQN